MLQKARDLAAPGVWFLTVRVAEVGVFALLVGAFIEARFAWTTAAQFSGNAPVGADGASIMQRITGMALFGGYRMPTNLLLASAALAGLLVVLHRCQPVSHTRVLRWEWLVLWAVSAVLALLASAIGVAALFADNPFASPDPSVVTGNIGPGYREQVVGNLSWPLGALLLMLPLGVWWARLPDMDDLEDALAADLPTAVPSAATEARDTVGSAASLTVQPTGGPVRPDRPRRPSDRQAPRRGRGGRPEAGRDGDRDAIFVDEVEQIEPVERLRPRGDDRGDGSSSSGYDSYLRRT